MYWLSGIGFDDCFQCVHYTARIIRAVDEVRFRRGREFVSSTVFGVFHLKLALEMDSSFDRL